MSSLAMTPRHWRTLRLQRPELAVGEAARVERPQAFQEGLGGSVRFLLQPEQDVRPDPFKGVLPGSVGVVSSEGGCASGTDGVPLEQAASVRPDNPRKMTRSDMILLPRNSSTLL